MIFPCCLEEDIAPYDASGNFDPAPLAALPDAAREEFWATLALRFCKGLGIRSLVRLLRGFGSAYGACRHLPDWGQFVAPNLATEFAREQWRQEATKEWQKAQKSNALILLWRSAHYPSLLRQLPDAPALLYLQGDASLLQGPAVAVVGSRNPSANGVKIAQTIGHDLAGAGITVVSGLALGIDRAAHTGALSAPGRSIGVLGTGVDVIYPKANSDVFAAMRKQGLLVSEFPLATPPTALNFPIRNRIISGLSLGVLVVEAAARSGSLVTAAQALDQNRDVFAVAGLPAVGCRNLISQGARAVTCAEDIMRDLKPALEQYRPTGPPPPGAFDLRPPLLFPPRDEPEKSQDGGSEERPRENATQSDKETSQEPPCAEGSALLQADSSALVLGALRSRGPLQADAIGDATAIAPAQLAAILLGLELTGQIELLTGSFYKAV